MEGFEPPTHDLGNTRIAVRPVRTHDFSVGYSGSHSDPTLQLGHQYAPCRDSPKFRTNGFSSVADCSHFNAPLISISKRRLKQLDAIELVRQQRENHQQQLAFHTRPFVLFGLPLRRPPNTQMVHARRSGKFFSHVTAHPDFGLPYGQDRLIPIWVATFALEQKNRTIHFALAAQMLDFFHLPKNGPHYRRMVGGFQRISRGHNLSSEPMKSQTEPDSSTSAVFTSSIACDSGSMQTQFGMTPITFQTRIQLPSARRFIVKSTNTVFRWSERR